MQSIARNNFGGQLGSALGSGINQLAELKLAELTKKYDQLQEKSNFAKTWEPILGKQSANFLSNMNPEERKLALGNIEELIQLNQPPSSAEQVNQLGKRGGLSTLTQQSQQQQPDQYQQLLQAARQWPQQQAQQFGQQAPQQQEVMQQQPQEQVTPERAKLVQKIFESPKDKAARKKLELENEKIARTEQLNADKETKKYFENALDLEKAADFSDIRLKKMENLVKKGGLPVSGFYNLFKNLEESVPSAYGAAAGGTAGGFVGGPVGAAIGSAIGGLISPIGTLLRFAQRKTSPNLEEFEKLSNDFIKDAKAIFGSRITDNDLKAFMATIPTLGQTDAGKLAIIHNMKMFNRASRIRAEAVKNVIRENGNRRPHNLQIIVEDRIKPQLDQLSQEFSVV
jgi:hypothetical protein